MSKFTMVTTFYDQNGKQLDLEQRKFKSEERWRTIFSNVPHYDEVDCWSKYDSIRDFLKEKRKNQMKHKKDKQSELLKQKEILIQKQTEIPDFQIEEIETSPIENETKESVSSLPPPEQDRLASVNENENLKSDKGVYKLQIGVTDFTKKIKDNEGMGISTFTHEDKENSTNQDAKLKIKRQSKGKLSLLSLRTDHFNKMFALATEKRKETLMKPITSVERFVRGIRITMLLMKTCRTSSQQTERQNQRFLTFANYQETGSIGKSSRMFDISMFKAQKEATLNVDVIEIMRLNPKMRSPEMIHAAVFGINSIVEAFSEFPLSMQTSLIKRGWYEKFESKRIIIRQGHAALNFYFIISGTTTVTVARNNKATGETYSETVAFLKKGNSFGELALMFGGKRSATVSCKTDVELLAVSREDFIDIFMSTSSKGEPEHIRFLRHLPLLSQWPIDKLPYDDPTICLFTYFRRGTVLCHDSNFGSWVYIVKSGTCRIIKLIQLNPQEQRDKIKLTKEEHEYMAFINKDSSNDIKKNPKDEIPLPDLKMIKEFDGKYYIQLKILNVGNIFGLEPMAFEFVGGTTGVTLISDGAELVAIERHFFKKLMTQKYQFWLRKELQPFPTIDNLKRKLQNFYHWEDYKENLIKEIVSNKILE